MKRFIFAGLLLALLTACGPFSKPNAEVSFHELILSVKNLDKDAWSGCQYILNASAGAENQYVYEAGDVPGLDSQAVLATSFIKADGKRFIPVITKATDVTIQCKNPGQPFSQAL